MADVAGPGAIVRIWSANPKGNLRLYLDHNPMPVLEVPISDLLGGRVAEIPPPIAGERSKGWNCYFPIPYAQHCKITSDQPGFYYHVNYRTYAPDTPIITLKVAGRTASDLKAYAAEIAEVAERLRAAQELGAAARPLSDEQQASEGRRASAGRQTARTGWILLGGANCWGCAAGAAVLWSGCVSKSTRRMWTTRCGI